MRHLYRCPIRWADLDMLGHVNNVIYVDYLQEARIDMLLTHAPDTRSADLAEGLVVVRHEVQFTAPLFFRQEPVSIECWVTEIRAGSFTMAYEIFDEAPEGRRVYVRASTVLTPFVFAEERPRRLSLEEKEVLRRFLEEGPAAPAAPAPPIRKVPLGHYPLQVRFSDVDVYGHVNNVKYFEYYQESRIDYFRNVAREVGKLPRAEMVLAQCDVDYRAPILFRPEPYAVHAWVTHVGRSSSVIESVILDGERLLSRARVVLVTFDAATQQAAPAPEELRQALLSELELARS
ncbi:acyl-CoA thioesterase [Nocardioides daejeonensis]|uniref:acyl-CoA thioesterase n=1 Tax=Nocardioides daejeonensis TaxID=1046556 RepID=UPI000D7400B1|nr:acyl-CoA thioesterase [Nocardioides daejeonensis]